jgi:hypothetical protein
MTKTYQLIVRGLLLLLLLSACGEGHEQMLRQLEELERMNRADSVMQNDTLAEHLVRYFDRHGDANERMRAHYILGRTYADMGEAPRAVDAYLDAASQADTMAEDCDYRTLGCVYSQMGDVYYRQLLLSHVIDARKKSYHYALIAGDTLGYITELKLAAGAYILLNKRDSAELLLKEALRQYEECGYKQEGIQSSTVLMYLYTGDEEHLHDLGSLIEKYDSLSDSFDENHELPPSKRQYYYYKGWYMEETGQMDSAEHYYRKVYRPNMSVVSQNPIYGGLLSVFQKRHQADSIAKYALLYCQANDSSIALNDQQLTAQMAASYQYNRFQKQAFENEKRADRERLRLYVLLIVAIISALAGISAFFQFKKRKHQEIERLKTNYAEATKQFNENLQAINLLEDTHKQVIKIIQQELFHAKDESSRYEERYQKAQSAIDDINNQYEAEILELKAENERLQESINHLKRYKDLTPFVENSQSFLNTGIVIRIMQNVGKSRYSMTEAEWNDFMAAVGKHFAPLIGDLNALEAITPTKMRICGLSILQLRTSDIANLLDIFPQRVTNLKGELNTALFGDNSARTLYHNLVQRYNILA